MTGPVEPDDILGTEDSAFVASLKPTPAELQALAQFKRQLEYIQKNNYSYLVLGDFSELPKRRLNNACQTLSGKGNTAAKMLIKLPYFEELDEINIADSGIETELKFHSLAENVSAIVMIAEGRNAGSAVELGDLTPTPGMSSSHPYFDKTYVAVRNYSDNDAEDIREDHPAYSDLISKSNGVAKLTNPMPYSDPQSNKFEIFDRNGRYWEWNDRTTLSVLPKQRNQLN
jgi:hypothetical protein